MGETVFQSLSVHRNEIQHDLQGRGRILADLLQKNAAPLQQYKARCGSQSWLGSLCLELFGQVFEVIRGIRGAEEGAETFLNGLSRGSVNVERVGLEE